MIDAMFCDHANENPAKCPCVADCYCKGKTCKATGNSSLAPLMSSANPNWQTPPEFLDIVRKVGPIGVDPCTTPDNPCGALESFYHPIGMKRGGCNADTPVGDGLSLGWTGGGLVFANPPYGRGLGKWTVKMRDEAKRGAEIIGLLPARTDTRWWGDVTTADAVCFWRGRLAFWAPHPETGVMGPALVRNKKTGKLQTAAAPFPSAVPYWGPRANEFRRIFSVHGWVVFSKQQDLFPVTSFSGP